MEYDKKDMRFYRERASTMYLKNPKEFSESPVAICAGWDCHQKEGKYCYNKLGCTAKRELDGSGMMVREEHENFMNILNNMN